MSIPGAVHSLQSAGGWLHSIGQMRCDYMFCASVIKLSCYSRDTFCALMPAFWLWHLSPPHNCSLPKPSCPSYYLSSIINATPMPRHTCRCIRIHTYTQRHACASIHVHRCVRKRLWDPAIYEGLPDTPGLWLIIFLLRTFHSEPHIMIIWNHLRRMDGKAVEWIYSDEEKLGE